MNKWFEPTYQKIKLVFVYFLYLTRDSHGLLVLKLAILQKKDRFHKPQPFLYSKSKPKFATRPPFRLRRSQNDNLMAKFESFPFARAPSYIKSTQFNASTRLIIHKLIKN